jgi:hypothetical protein
MKKIRYLLYGLLVLFLISCGTTEKAFDPLHKYSPPELKKDYQIFRNTLEDWHPSLYWYNCKDSMNYYFDRGYAALTDSMTELQFKTLLSFVIAQVHCGHTSVHSSKAYSKYLDSARLTQFPLIIKCWDDTMVVAANLNRHDTVLKRGTIIQSINGRTVRQLTDTLFDYIVTDGYNLTGKYQYLSTGLNFSAWYRNVIGYTPTFTVGYLDANKNIRETVVPLYDPKADTINSPARRRIAEGPVGRGQGPGDKRRRMSKKDRRERERFFMRNLQFDSTGQTAFMAQNTFEHGFGLGKFFKRSFRALDEEQVQNLVIDVRSNGGGDATNSTLLTRYLIDHKFKMADSLYAIRRHSPYDKYIHKGFLYRILTVAVSRKRSDGKYHFAYFENHVYSPKSKHHFNGQVYILTGGNSFSATCLFAGAVKGQKNVTLVGEETGGGYYGNTAWMIPDVILPVTGIRFRLPRFHLVVDKNRVKDGRGVMPDVTASPSVDQILRGEDFKMSKAKELIRLHAAGKE